MPNAPSIRILAEDEPAPVGIERAEGRSALFLTCDHAGRRIPRALGNLGVEDTDLRRHIGWDIGALGTARILSDRADAPLVFQRYSRLVIDCNRSPEVLSAFVTVSDGTLIPGNRDLSAEQRAARVAEIFTPYHAEIAGRLDARAAAGQPTLLVAMHSFTPLLGADPTPRPWQIGILFNRDRRAADILLDLLRSETEYCVGENQPYSVSDTSDYGVPVHGERRGLPHIEIEIRQDLIAEPAGQRHWGELLAELLGRVAERLGLNRP